MAGGPIFPASVAYDGSANVYPLIYVGDGANAHRTETIGCVASLGSNAEVDLEFFMPPSSLPSGTGKLRIVGMADAVTGSAQITPSWASVAMGEDPSAATLTSEGTTTMTWSTNDDDEYQEATVTLDADTLVAGEIVVMHLQFTTASWTLAVESGWRFSIIWE